MSSACGHSCSGHDVPETVGVDDGQARRQRPSRPSLQEFRSHSQKWQGQKAEEREGFLGLRAGVWRKHLPLSESRCYSEPCPAWG